MKKDKNNKQNAPGQIKEYVIIVNGREKTVNEKKISFSKVVELAFGPVQMNDRTIYTVTYCKGTACQKQGIMVSGDDVRVKEGMVFNVTATDKS